MIPLIPLVTLEAAIEHLQTPSENEAEVKKKLILASAIVMNYMKLTAIPEDWIVTEESPMPEVQPEGEGYPRPIKPTKDISVIETYDSPVLLIRVPGNVQTAVLLILGELYEHHESSGNDLMSKAIIDLLTPFRDPTFS